MNDENSTVATSAMPIGMPGWPDFAACTASMERKRMASAILEEREEGALVILISLIARKGHLLRLH